VSTVVVLARLGLSALFALAGAGKLADLAGSRRAVSAFGVPQALAGMVGTAIPVAELAVAAALIGSASARWGAAGALALLGGFSVGIVGALARGLEPDCHCFGQLHSAPAGWLTLARALVLAGAAAVVLFAGPGLGIDAWLGSWSPAQAWELAAVLAAGVVIGQSALVWRLLRRHGAVLVRVRELEAAAGSRAGALAIGDPAPAFDLPGLAGERVSLTGLLSAGRRVLLVFTDPSCGPCQGLLPTLAGWQDAHPGGVQVALISRGHSAENLSARDEHGLRHVARQAERETDVSYGVLGTPSAILIGTDGRVAGPLVAGAERITALADDLTAGGRMSPAGGRGHVDGDPASELRSPSAHGERARLEVDRRSATGLAGGVAVLGGVAATAATASAAGGAERAAATRIAGELGVLIRRIAPDAIAASRGLGAARITTPGKPIRVPAATRAAWRRRLHDIDQAHTTIGREHRAGAARTAALDALGALRAACQAGELALTSSSAAKRNHYAKQQHADEARLGTAIKTLTTQLRKAGATHL
jgi:methylamine dehydrogenase accessory protein MauD